MPKRLVLCAIAVAAFASPCVAQDIADVTAIAAAREAVARGDWQAAVEPLTELVAQSPQNGEFRIDLARAHYYTGKQAEAEADYRAAFEIKAVDPAIAAYGVAKCNALLGRREEMLKWLRLAMSLGLRRLEGARGDEDFKAYRSDPDFRKLVGLAGTSKLSRDEGWRGDIAMLADWVGKKSLHPFKTSTGDRYVSGAAMTETEFDGTVRKLVADVPKLSDSDIEIALFRLVAALGDGHTAIEGSHTRAEFALTLPLGFYVFDDGVYVISAAPAYADLVGAKVVALDGTQVRDVLARLDPLISRDNAQWVKAMEPHFLRHTPFLKALGIAKADDTVDLSLVLRDGSRREVPVKADMTQPDIWNALPKPGGWTWAGDRSASAFQQDNDKAYWWRWMPADGIIYVQYNKVVDTKEQTLAAFAQELSGAIARYPVKKLVIDMRNNNGGDTYLNEALLAAIAGNAKVDRLGHLYVITGRRTFSAAMNAVSYFGRFTKAVFVGEPTGGKPNAPGDETPFTLPYSGIVVNLSDRYWQGGWPDDFSESRAPDIAATQIFADYAAGRDAAMEIVRAQPDISR
jgi:tetratricopeptide (TPR) repeat protein